MEDFIEIRSIQFKRGKKATLEKELVGDNKLKNGEPAYETDRLNAHDIAKLKIGDGVHDYKDLPYVSVSIEVLNAIKSDLEHTAHVAQDNIAAAAAHAESAYHRATELLAPANLNARVGAALQAQFVFISRSAYNKESFDPDPDIYYFVYEDQEGD